MLSDKRSGGGEKRRKEGKKVFNPGYSITFGNAAVWMADYTRRRGSQTEQYYSAIHI